MHFLEYCHCLITIIIICILIVIIIIYHHYYHHYCYDYYYYYHHCSHQNPYAQLEYCYLKYYLEYNSGNNLVFSVPLEIYLPI